MKESIRTVEARTLGLKNFDVFRVLLAVVIGCSLLWWLTGYYIQRQAGEILADHDKDLIQISDQLSVGLRSGLGMLHGIPAAVGQNETLQTELRRFLQLPPAQQTREEKRQSWSREAELASLDHWLSKFTEKLGVMSVIWVMNTTGDAILASNYLAADSFVGTNYSDREYFTEAMAGRQGIQYAMGRRTNLPGLFFSSPVTDANNGIIGVVAGKIDLSFLDSWMGHANVLISDQYGVVILARDKTLEMRLLPDAKISTLSEKSQMDRYKRNTFDKVDIFPWSDALAPELKRFDNRKIPFLLKTTTLEEGEAFLTTLIPVGELARIEQEHLRSFLLLLALSSGVALFISHMLQRRRNERLLRESDARLATVFRASPVGMLLVRWSDHKVLEINDFMLQLFGYGREEVARCSLQIQDLYGSEHERLESGLQEAGHIYGLEFKTVRRDGLPVIHLVSAEKLELSGDLCYLATVVDITPIKQLEESLHEVKLTLEQRVATRTQELSQMVEERAKSQALLRTVVDTVPIRIFWKDRESRYMGCNPPFARDAGKNDPSELLGLDDSHLGWADQAERYQLDDRKVMESGQGKLGYEEPQSAPNGDLRWLRTSKVPLRNSHNEVVGVLGVYEDITEFKRGEQQLTLAMGKLQNAMSQVEIASRFKSEFLANMSHEIRTPMNAIIGLVDLALHLEMSPRLRDYLNKIANASRSLLRIINDILDFSKIEAGKITLESADFTLGRVIENLADIFRNSAAENNLELVLGIDPQCPTLLHGDSLRLEQVLMNLISNALKFTKQGSVRVWVSREAIAPGPTVDAAPAAEGEPVVLRFTVQDSGIGLTKEQITGLFTPFCQADSSTTRQFGGTGLGLSICKRLVELMEGKIWVESEPGVGSLFGFTALFTQRSGLEQEYSALPDSLVDLPVLLVDDNDIAREILQVTLQTMRFRPFSVASGEEAMAAVTRMIEAGTPYPLVLLDYKMPGMNGIETARQIADFHAEHGTDLPRPKMILLSAFGLDAGLSPQAKASGLEVFLSKPVTRSRLFDAVSDVMGLGLVHRHQPEAEGIDHKAVFDQVGGARILLVEDNAINQQVAKEMLELLGLKVSVAGNGLEATRMVLETPFDLIFMDIQMPVMDGYAAVRHIRANPQFATLPIVAMTAHAMDGDRQKSLDVGMNGHITKPIDRKQLYAVLLRWITPGQRAKPEAGLLLAKPPERAGCTIPLDLPGIDVEAGLERLGGNHQLLRTLLLESGRDFAEVVGKVRTALAGEHQDDWLVARSLVHAVKGVAGNISAVDLHQAAAMLEQSIDANQRDHWPALLSHLEQVLLPLLDAIHTLEPDGEKESVAPGRVEAEPEQVRALLDQLADFIRQGNSKAINALADLKPCLLGEVNEQDLAALERAINRFDFKSARIALVDIAQSWNKKHAQGGS